MDHKMSDVSAPTQNGTQQQAGSPQSDAAVATATSVRSSSFASTLTQPFKFVKKAIRGTTFGTILLARHVNDILKEDLMIDINFKHYPDHISKELKSLENLASYLRWLRGVLCLFGVASFVLALLVVLLNEVRLSYAIVGISFIAQLLLLRIYAVKATFASLTNPLYRNKGTLFFSPYFFEMIGEMLFWTIQTPPSLEDVYPYDMLGFIVFGRIYCVVLYFNNATIGYRTFCRAMSAVVDVPLSNWFFLRASLIYNKFKTGSIIIVCSWLTLALMFSKSENQTYADSLWFTFVTVGTIGYGDFAAVTAIGRFSAFLMYVFSLIGVGYAVVLTHDTLALKEHERNLYLLFRSNELGISLKDQAARTIQRSWRWYAAKKRGAFVLTLNWLAWRLLQEATAFRKSRDTLREAARKFRESVAKADEMAEVVKGQKKAERGFILSPAPVTAASAAPVPSSVSARQDLHAISSMQQYLSQTVTAANIALVSAAATGGKTATSPIPISVGQHCAACASSSSIEHGAPLPDDVVKKIAGLEDKVRHLTSLVSRLAAQNQPP